MASRLLLFCLLFLVGIPASFCQSDKDFKKAEKFFEEKDFIAALNKYLEILEKDPQNAQVNLKVAQCYMLSSGKSKALQYASNAVKYSNNPTREMYYTLAEAHQVVHSFDSAIHYYKKSDPGNANKKVISKKLQECNNGKQYLKAPVNVKITNIGEIINSPEQEYLPYITADGMALFFTSRRAGSTGGKRDRDGRYFEDIYLSRNKGGAWDTPANIGAPLNSEIHDACAGISPDGQTIFIYKGTNGGDLYISDLNGARWKTAQPLTAVNTEFFESTACLSPDGRTMFFVRKGMGSRDIYICTKTIGGAWSKPKKLDVVNTEFDEDSPFMHPDGKTLYFSSKGHATMGGYDIFKTTRTAAGSWTTPENLGYPINSAGDDIYFVLTASGKIGYYSSDKEGGFGQQDIYSIRMPVAPDPQLALLQGQVKDEGTGKPLEATITVTDNDSKEILGKFYSNTTTGEYLIPLPSGKNYGIAIEKEGHLFYSENVFLTAEEGYKEIRKDIKLPSAKSGSKVILKNIFFDSGKSLLKPASAQELQRLISLLRQNLKLKIEVSGHTDNTGDEKENQKLSEVRAKNVADFLIANGIEKERISYKGYGSKEPVESNEDAEGRQANRRTEFKIL